MISKEFRLNPDHLDAKKGLGNSLTCFAEDALLNWQKYVKPALKRGRSEYRKAIYNFAASGYMHPILAIQVVRHCLHKERRSHK